MQKKKGWEESRMFCAKCGKEIPDDSVFCPFCGSSIVQKKEEQQEQVDNIVKKSGSVKWIIVGGVSVAIVIGAIIAAVLLLGKDKSESSPVSSQVIVPQTEEPDTTENDIIEAEDLSMWLGDFSSIENSFYLTIIQACYDSTLMDGSSFTYALYDFDNDGSSELIITGGTCTADTTTRVYSMQDDGTMLGSLRAGASNFYADEEGMLNVYAHTGYASVERITIENGELVTESLFEGASEELNTEFPELEERSAISQIEIHVDTVYNYTRANTLSISAIDEDSMTVSLQNNMYGFDFTNATLIRTDDSGYIYESDSSVSETEQITIEIRDYNVIVTVIGYGNEDDKEISCMSGTYYMNEEPVALDVMTFTNGSDGSFISITICNVSESTVLISATTDGVTECCEAIADGDMSYVYIDNEGLTTVFTITLDVDVNELEVEADSGSEYEHLIDTYWDVDSKTS